MINTKSMPSGIQKVHKSILTVVVLLLKSDLQDTNTFGYKRWYHKNSSYILCNNIYIIYRPVAPMLALVLPCTLFLFCNIHMITSCRKYELWPCNNVRKHSNATPFCKINICPSCTWAIKVIFVTFSKFPPVMISELNSWKISYIVNRQLNYSILCQQI